MDVAAQRDDESAPFFDAAERGSLVVRRCRSCGHLRAPEVAGCAECHESDYEWTPGAGGGTLVTWAVIHQRTNEGGVRTWPVGTVELDEGPWITAPVVGVEPAELHPGLPLGVTTIRPGGGEAIPAFARRSSRPGT